jgi:DNA-binding CsgD family transcriptional regulator
MIEVTDRARHSLTLPGHDQDLTAIWAFVDEFPAHGGVMLLSGEPGIGKSALLEAAAGLAAASGHRVLRAAGAEREEVDFAVLNQLLLPLRADLGRLGCGQRDVLDVALGFRPGPVCDQLVVANAVLALLLAAAASRPLLLIVDNLPWVDRATALVLGFVARRLRGNPVGLVTAERSGSSRLFDLGAADHEVRPLDDDAARRLVTTRHPDLAPGVRRRIVREARGNPLALLELAAGLSAPQRTARTPLPACLPLSGRFRALVAARVAALPPAAGYLLLLAVLEGTGDLALLHAAAAGDCQASDLACAVQAGLAQVDEAAQRVVVPHPLIRSAVLELAGGGQVRRAHLALAARLSGQPERRAWHLAGAVTSPDGGEAGAEGHGRRAHPRPDSGDAGQARRLAVAAYLSAGVTGDLGAAETLLADARRAWPGSAWPAETALATALVLLHGDGDAAGAHRLLLRAVAAARGDGAGPRHAEEALKLLGTVTRLSGLPAHRKSLDRLIAESGPDERAAVRRALGPLPGQTLPGQTLPGQTAGKTTAGKTTASGPDETAGALASQAEPAEIVRIAAASALTDGLPDCRQALRRVARPEPDGSVGTPGLQARVLLALESYQTGQWDEARRLAEAAADQGARRGYQLVRRQAQTVLAFVAASRGDAQSARVLADDIARWAAPRGLASLLAGAQYAGVLAALAQADFPAVYQQAAAISPAGGIPAHEPFAPWVLLDLVEAALRTGRPGEATAHVQAVQRAGLAAVSSRLALLSAAAQAMTAPDDEAADRFDRALAADAAGRWPFERARVHLLAGERLRRTRALTAARVHLAAAADEFRRLGAPTWADRAASTLRATGQAPQRVDRRGHPLLTPQELEIAQLAAAGLSNREIAGRLFISHRTVASHLFRIFPKLGITSRAALGRVLPHDEAGLASLSGQ